jgi:hypothetical protein
LIYREGEVKVPSAQQNSFLSEVTGLDIKRRRSNSSISSANSPFSNVTAQGVRRGKSIRS